MKRLLALLLCVALLNVFVTVADAAPALSATCACVVERNTGRLLYGLNENQKASMASTTKIMTALLLCESVCLEDTAVITQEMVQVEGSSMGLQVGDTVHYRDLLYGMMLASGNDAATATAVLLAGSVPLFAKWMNARAKEIGMKNTHFVTPSGLDASEHYSTAYDMSLLAVEAMKNEDFAQAVGAKSAVLEFGNPPYKRTFKNHNRLLNQFDGCDGVKTGFTKKSGRCLVSSAKRGDAGVIAVTLRDPNDWEDHAALLSYGLSLLTTQTLSKPSLPKIKVIGGLDSYAEVVCADASVSLLPNDFTQITSKLEVNTTVFAPLEAGEQVGQVIYQFGGKTVATAPVTVARSVAADMSVLEETFWYWIHMLIVKK